MIRKIIVFIVAFVCLLIGRFMVLPNIQVGIHSLDNELLSHAWDALMRLCDSVFGFILAAILVLYIVYKVLSKIFPISLFIGKIPPIRELRRSGLFSLMDSLINAVIGGGSLGDRFKRVGRGLGNFALANRNMLRDEVKRSGGDRFDLSKKIPSTSVRQSTEKDFPENNANASPFTDEEIQQTRVEYQQCMEENAPITTEDMTAAEVKISNIQRQFNSTYCNIKSFQSALNIFGFKE